MKFRTIIFAIQLPLLWCCASQAEKGNVVFETAADASALTDVIKSIEIIPLEKTNGSAVGPARNTEVCLLGRDYIVADRLSSNIFRFSPEGRFLCSLGPVGEIIDIDGCPVGEMPDRISNIQVDRDEVTAVYATNRAVHYSADGRILSENTVEDLGYQSFFVPEGILTYFGYGAGRPYRVALLKDRGIETFLPDESKVISMDPSAPIFFPYNGSVFFTDTYGSGIYRYDGGEVSPVVIFDFGDTALGERYFQFDDSFAAAEYMLSKRFTLVQRYIRNGKYQIVETFTQDMGEVTADYGICKGGGEWKWFSLGMSDSSPFFNSLRQLDEDALYCLLDAGLLAAAVRHPSGTNLDAFLPFISNPEVLQTVSAGDNPVIAKIYLK